MCSIFLKKRVFGSISIERALITCALCTVEHLKKFQFSSFTEKEDQILNLEARHYFH